LLYITDWTRALHLWDSGLLEHTWSLAIEEQFYLLWPVALIFVVRRWGFRAGGWLAAGLIVASASDCTILWATGASVARTSAGLDVRVDVLMVGCALGVAATAGWLPEGIRRAGASLAMAGAVAVVAVMTVAKYDQGWLATPGLTVFAAAVGWVILGVVVDPHSSLAKLLAHPVLTHIGRISYGLYLWHYPVFGLGLPQLRSLPHPLAALVVFVTAFAAAELSHRVVERPFLDRKRRFEAGRLPDTTPLPVPNGALQRVGNDGAFGPRG
jgi:peptidoglycan/LPS O-acetylase OafA/YrhL